METDNKYNLKKFPYRINWEITQQCNFNCSYCSNAATVNKTPPPLVYAPIQLSEFFLRTGRNWLILITGGEPFLYPNFVDVCHELSKNHHLQITTNLSSSKIFEFAEKINPDKIFNINASYHHEIRADNDLHQDFLKKCIILKDNGFPILVNLIAHPSFINTVKTDAEYFTKLGLECIIFGFRGTYKNKTYPQAYKNSELDLIKSFSQDDTEIKIALNKLNFYGYYCDAGNRYFGLKQNGDLIRCFTLSKKIGNLFTGDFPKKLESHPCISHQCTDCYNGVASITNKKASFFSIYREKKRYNKLNYGE
ncbi:MAG: radical SAM protein [Bacteroidales bacterium]|nr:radical SAM protein [Bacteroidales bacterium]